MARHALTSRSRRVGCCQRRLLVGIALLAPVLAATAIAAPPLTGLPESARLVSDEELGEMRGRYIAPELVNFFGIQMVSMWQTGDGSVLTASLEFETNLVDPNPADNVEQREFDPNASLWANWSHIGCESECDESLNIVDTSIPDGLNSIGGAVQTATISGNDNDVVNIMRIRIGDFDASSVGYEGNSESAPVLSTGLKVELPDGFIVQFSKGENALGLVLQGPGTSATNQAEGMAYQGINGGAVNQIAQHVDVIGDANAIQNTLDVVIGLEQLQTTQIAVENALSAMKGWGF